MAYFLLLSYFNPFFNMVPFVGFFFFLINVAFLWISYVCLSMITVLFHFLRCTLFGSLTLFLQIRNLASIFVLLYCKYELGLTFFLNQYVLFQAMNWFLIALLGARPSLAYYFFLFLE